ncbi:hypothetical protein [Alkalihalobacterium chitinilyticum]|uniref:DUF4625 domain-containing protein n=1 Tax=Alkalihalobacterium chitinilyticum TaxID=2980103 RepID=A0ABT5VFW7_9BACI|nr:hypothetical protein [Alkalihalobacterium chitinilyticum]MDE5414355.1 hypothetical protein [Alkalihalobacterium chitinilyticum]
MKWLAIFLLVLSLFLTGCKSNDLHKTPPFHPHYFDMTIDLYSEDNEYIVKTKVTLLMETSQIVTLQFILQEVNTSNAQPAAQHVSNVEPFEKELYFGSWTVGEEKYFEIPFNALPKGEYNIQIKALTAEDLNGEMWGGLATINFKTNEERDVIEKVIDIVMDH